ncbi:BnaA05g32980D [Brassica napus]|uniref:BnaA05g32980D protein n=1 Tax=Brassica napus TaxID=3708 RepID=A0A078IH66_BRANA|nr:BnaA05g32980D [Brassica napus]
MSGKKYRNKAMKIVVGTSGVTGVRLEKDKETLTVEGEGVDVLALARALEKKAQVELLAIQGTMKSLRQRKDRRTSSSLVDTDQQHSSLPLPIDLTIDIFSRLSLKSVAISRCVSKPWALVLDRNNLFFLSSPQPQSPDEMLSVAADHHMSFSFDHPVKDISSSVHGLVCVRIKGHRFVNGRRFKVEESVLCNPSTGQSLTIPKVKTRKRVGIVSLLGYDPVEKLHKVLGMIWLQDGITMEHQVLTLGGGGASDEKLTWRMAERGIPCPCPSSAGTQNICIGGVFYYIHAHMIICFDVRTEKYSFVKPPKGKLYHRLLDCNGKLALVPLGKSYYFNSETVKMWVLEDRERHEWSKRVYTLPPMWKDVVDPEEWLVIVGVTGPNEFVMSSEYSGDPFQVYYCNFDKETDVKLMEL